MIPWTAAARLSCPSLSPGVCPNSHPLSQWCYATISSSSVHPCFSSCLQSFPASGPFPVSRLFTSGGQSTGASALASVLPMNIQVWFPLGLTGLTSLQSKWLSRVFSSTTIWEHQFFALSLLYGPVSHPYLTTGKTIVLIIRTSVSKVLPMLFSMLSRFDIVFFQAVF